MRSLRSTLVLVVVLAGLVGYIYYLNSATRASTDAKEKAFASVKDRGHRGHPHQVGDGRDDARAEGRRHLEDRRTGSGGGATRGELSSITSSLATLEIQRVVDENGVRPEAVRAGAGPRHRRVPVQGRQGAKANRARREDAHRRRSIRPPPGTARVFLVSSFLDSTFNKTTFALRDKTIIKIERKRSTASRSRRTGPAVTLAKTGTEWRIVAPMMARADFAAVEGALERLSSAQMQGIVPADGADLAKRKLDPPVASLTAVAAARAPRCCSGPPKTR